MHARIPYVLVGDVGFYERAEIKDVLALLRLCATPEDRQSDESFRRVINVPARGFGAKALQEVEDEAAWRQVPLLTALETAELPPKTRSAGLAFVDAIKGVARDRAATLADQMSLVIDATGYRAMLRDSKAETTEGRLENVQGTDPARRQLPYRPRTAGPRSPLDQWPEGRQCRPGPADDAAQREGARVPARLPARLGGGLVPARLRRNFRGAPTRVCGDNKGHAAGDDHALRLPPRLRQPVLLHRRSTWREPLQRMVAWLGLLDRTKNRPIPD